MSIRVLIADDHSMIREGLKQLLELDGEIVVVSEAKDGRECIEQIRKTKPDVILLDINMPVMDGLEVLSKLREAKNNTKVLMLTIHNEIEYLIKAVDIGCNGYVLKDSSFEILKKAINTVYYGETYIEPQLIPLLNSTLAKRDTANNVLDTLTKREIQILKYVASGITNREIGEKLNISERTVKNHVSSMFKKIGVADRTQAAIFAIKYNLIDF